MQLICMFSLLDCLAQEEAKYPVSFKKAFCQFVLKHQKQCDYLEQVDPVTLYYHVEEIIDETALFPDVPPEKELNLKPLEYMDGKLVKEVVYSDKANEILDYIAKKKDRDFADEKKQEHQLIYLIYRMRSKAVHEMSGLGEDIYSFEDFAKDEPFYLDIGRNYVLNGDLMGDDVLKLIIPNIFIRNILQDCVYGYLNECEDKKRFPFENNHMTRKHILSWYYDK